MSYPPVVGTIEKHSRAHVIEKHLPELICNSKNSPKGSDGSKWPVGPLGAIRAKARRRIEQDKRSRR